MWGYWKEGRGGRGKAKIMRWLSIEGVRSQARCLMTEWELLHQAHQLLQSVANEHFERRQGCPGREMPTSLSSPAEGFSCESKQLPILGTFWLFWSLNGQVTRDPYRYNSDDNIVETFLVELHFTFGIFWSIRTWKPTRKIIENVLAWLQTKFESHQY